jgi:hypothetical protein
MSLVGSHHTTVTAASEAEVHRLARAWFARFERELADHRQSPDGVEKTVPTCCGPRAIVWQPSWLPARPPPPEALSFRFETVTNEREGLWTGHLSAWLERGDD